MGWKGCAPFDAIMVTAGSPKIPQPFLEQLAEGGSLIIPVGNKTSQELIQIEKQQKKYISNKLGSCRFVDLCGVHGWKK